jgi:hypothetical protein
MTQTTDPYQRVHIAADHGTVIEHCTTDLRDDDPVAVALSMPFVVAVSLRYSSGETLSYSKRVTA